jgi:hypothetical protein
MKNKILLAFLITAIGCTPTSKKTNFIEGGWISKKLNQNLFYVAHEGDYLTSSASSQQIALDTARRTCLKAGNSGDFKIINGTSSSSHSQIGAFTMSFSFEKPTSSYIIECESTQRLNNLVNYRFNAPRSIVAYPEKTTTGINRQRFNAAWEKYIEKK